MWIVVVRDSSRESLGAQNSLSWYKSDFNLWTSLFNSIPNRNPLTLLVYNLGTKRSCFSSTFCRCSLKYIIQHVICNHHQLETTMLVCGFSCRLCSSIWSLLQNLLWTPNLLLIKLMPYNKFREWNGGTFNCEIIELI